MEHLIEDYKRRVKTVENDLSKIQKEGIRAEDVKTHNRLLTKVGCYKTIIGELERANRKEKEMTNLLFHIEMDDQPSHSWERYYIQASSKKDALNKLFKKEPQTKNRKMVVRRIPKNEIITDIY